MAPLSLSISASALFFYSVVIQGSIIFQKQQVMARSNTSGDKVGIEPSTTQQDPIEPAEKDVRLEDSSGHTLHKQLETRHMTMIALGGALGTGLLIGTYV